MWYHGQDTRYQPLTEGESKEVCGTASLPVESTEHKASRLLQLWVTALTIAGSLLLGFLLGRYSVSQPPLTRDGLIGKLLLKQVSLEDWELSMST